MESLYAFWTWAYILAIGAFYLTVLVIVPLGFRDLLHLFRALRKPPDDVESEKER